jgi:hypothetical protein
VIFAALNLLVFALLPMVFPRKPTVRQTT